MENDMSEWLNLLVTLPIAGMLAGGLGLLYLLLVGIVSFIAIFDSQHRKPAIRVLGFLVRVKKPPDAN